MHCGNPFDLRGDASRNLQEQAMLFEMSCKKMNPDIDRSITLEKYTEIWLQTIAPDKLAKSTLVREKQDILSLLAAARKYTDKIETTSSDSG